MSRAKARRSDPSTSRAAARSVGDLTENQRSVLFIFRMGSEPLLDEELVAIYQKTQKVAAYRLPQQSESGIRSRRAELSKQGLLTMHGGRKMSTGRLGRTWRITSPEE